MTETSQVLDRKQNNAKKQYLDRADEWTADQATRLGVGPKDILDAIGRGWTSESVVAVDDGQALGYPPPVAGQANVRLKVVGYQKVIKERKSRSVY